MGGNCSQDQAVGLLLGDGSEVQVCSEEGNLKWGQASSTNVEEVTPKVSFDLTAAEAALPSPQFPHLSLFPSLQECFPEITHRPQQSPLWCPSVNIGCRCFLLPPQSHFLSTTVPGPRVVILW